MLKCAVMQRRRSEARMAQTEQSYGRQKKVAWSLLAHLFHRYVQCSYSLDAYPFGRPGSYPCSSFLIFFRHRLFETAVEDADRVGIVSDSLLFGVCGALEVLLLPKPVDLFVI